MTEHEPTLEEMLAEVRRIRESLAELSSSAKSVTKAIEGVLGDKITYANDEQQYNYDDSYDG